ncbi:tripartite tricarboxylate transporter substrate-binding protein [Pelagibacterium halotolerans]|uniref:Putative exported protein n=1 Tax=Pelagibacterium halotolerans (strain DSM 22347 / JCM 15775 / CGMCC 1.7692 / B2) TaxID=1082931 RepID=G4R9G9_PELHB|nr:tripartite tricarboxylate transporter substrate-binding protein [Pelagibacterium halotolerans]AEQ50389.1 putative exported protein [Pelagibacterium halotolerans B2]QJR19635.1 tripartite tricarboxylate transporter substrate binding protein [Pelagibacterium halotolerans]SDZ86043.1 Tripartite-type tricarboxylate transporter, receptor component TctC [Pelagibacterium halotolerans]
MKTISALAGIAAALILVGPTSAQDWPERPVNMIVAYGAGGGTDTLARIVADPLSRVVGQPVVVENRAGAGGTIGAAAAADADPDGYTLYMMANGHTVAGAMYASLPYDPVADFQGISEVASMPLVVIARPDFEADTLEELIALSQARPGELNFASVGVGSSQHFAGELLAETAGIDMMHIPYQNTPEALAAVLSGEVDMLVEVLAPMLGQITSGDIKALAVTSAQRHPKIPEVATVAEGGFDGFDVSTWYGIAVPAGTDAALAEQINAAVSEALEDEAMIAQLGETGYIVQSTDPASFTAKIGSEVERWQQVRVNAGIDQL